MNFYIMCFYIKNVHYLSRCHELLGCCICRISKWLDRSIEILWGGLSYAARGAWSCFSGVVLVESF